MKKTCLIVGSIALGACAGSQARPRHPGDDTPMAYASPGAPPSASDANKLAHAVNAFGFDLWRAAAPPHGNGSISPVSIHVALAMTEAGARGETRTELAHALRLDTIASEDHVHAIAGEQLAVWNADSSGPTLRVVNRLFGEETYPFENAYLSAMSSHYRAPLEMVSFLDDPEDAREEINDWVADQTEDHIRDLLPRGMVDERTRLVLTNAVYFLGRWEQPFPAENTGPRPFHVRGGAPVAVSTMSMTESYAFAHVEGVRALELPYVGGESSMLLLLPDDQNGLPALEAALDADGLERIVSALAPRQVNVSLPKFEIDGAAIELTRPLREMGVTLAFDADRADLTGIAPIVGANRLYVAAVVHKTFVRVDELGTEAAAASEAMGLDGAAFMERPEDFTADHPFLFLLRDERTGAVFFVGRVDEPRG